jgi:hypothetical protein
MLLRRSHTLKGRGRTGLRYLNGQGSRIARASGTATTVTYPDGRRAWFVEGEKVREERSASQPSPVKAR